MKLIGIGDNTVDDYTHIRTLFPGGNALNVAVYASQLGCDSAYLGVFGSDAAADHMQEVLAGLGVDISRCCYADGASGKATLTIEDGERVFTGSNDGGVRKTVSMDFIFDHSDYLRGFTIAHTSAYSFIDEHLPRLQPLVPILSYDFSDDFEHDHALSLCQFIDVAVFSCSELSEDETEALLRQAVGEGSTLAVATRGAREAIVFDGHSWYRRTPQPVAPTDTLGAGDAFISAFLVTCFADGRDKDLPLSASIGVALDEAAAFAAQTCGVQGAFGHGLRY